MKDALVTTRLIIPEELLPALASGEMIRRGGVIVDNASKQVVKWLDEIPMVQTNTCAPVEAASASIAKASITSRILATIKQHKAASIGIGIGVVIAIGCTVYYVVDKNKQKKANDKQIPNSVVNFKAVFSTYLIEARDGTLSIDTVKKLEKAIALLEHDAEGNSITLDFSNDDFHKLMSSLLDYTKRLTDAKKLESSIDQAPIDNNLVCLKKCLEQQRNVLEKAA